MTDCEDDHEAPAASRDALRDTFESLGDAFREEAEQNVTDRATGEPIAEQPERGPAERLDPYFPETILLAPHENGNEGRPLDRRSDGSVPPLYSDSVDVQADVVQPGEETAVECTVRNLGGKPARHARVELWAEHYDLAARVDSADGVFELPKEGTDVPITGVTTVAPTSRIVAFAVADDDGPPFEQVLDYTDPRMVVDENRTFSGTLGPRPTEFQNGDPVPDGLTDFRLELWETTVPDLYVREFPEPYWIPVYVAPEERQAQHLATLDGRYVDGPTNSDREDQFLTSSMDRVTHVSRQTTAITAGGASTLTFQYEPLGTPGLPPGLEDFEGDIPDELGPGFARSVTALYVRAYSMAASELPANWNALDHTESRFVGRSEVLRTS